MEKLKAEIERKRLEAEALRLQAASVSGGEGGESEAQRSTNGKKFIRQNERELFLQKQLEEEQRKLDEAGEERRKQRFWKSSRQRKPLLQQ